ncbi:MAG: hypothetical protein EB075_10340 [Bacteroidetes bacterium]|nr:hypothetical protein [Bacteroidota bacterium]
MNSFNPNLGTDYYFEIDARAAAAAFAAINPTSVDSTDIPAATGATYEPTACCDSLGPLDSDEYVREDMDSAYIQLNFESEMLGRPLNTVAGLRYEKTDSQSTRGQKVTWQRLVTGSFTHYPPHYHYEHTSFFTPNDFLNPNQHSQSTATATAVDQPERLPVSMPKSAVKSEFDSRHVGDSPIGQPFGQTAFGSDTQSATSVDARKRKGKEKERMPMPSTSKSASKSKLVGGNIEFENDADEARYRADLEVQNRLKEKYGIIELLDCGETDMCYIAMYDSHVTREHTHVEIHPSLILSILSNQTNYVEHNASVRDMYSPGQLRQTMSVYHTNYMNRMDSAYLLHYGQTPIAHTFYYDTFTNGEHPCGENIIVAVMSYTGYNVEDSIIFNEGSIKRGTLNITYFTSESAHEFIAGSGNDSQNSGPRSKRKKANDSSILFKNVPDYEVENTKPGYNYANLDETGIIKENTPIDDKTVLVGRVKESRFTPGTFTDDSIFTHKEQAGFVHKVFVAKKSDGSRMVKLRIREHRPPDIGDKFVSRCAQKGTIGLILKEEDMPYTKDGLRPDIIINPHAFPSRKVVGQMIECIISKACAYYGYHSDCTSFRTAPHKNLHYGRLLRKLGMHSSGNEIMYSGFTGEQIEAEIYIGPTYYMRLKHLVDEKVRPIGSVYIRV